MRTPAAATLVSVPGGIAHALSIAGGMTWEILWALVLGFFLSGVEQAAVSKREMTRLLPDDSPRTLAISCGLGAASSSCSYAAVALARSIFRNGANFTAATAFEFASTNVVIELGIILALLIGWQFTLAEFVGGPLMVVFLALLFRAFLTPRLLEMARRQAEKASGAPWKATPNWTCRWPAARSGLGSPPPRASPRSATTSGWTGRPSTRTSSEGC